MSQLDWMYLYIKVGFWLSLLNILGKFALLSWVDYPRTVTWSRAEDCFAVLMGIGGAIFTWWLAWG